MCGMRKRVRIYRRKAKSKKQFFDLVLYMVKSAAIVLSFGTEVCKLHLFPVTVLSHELTILNSFLGPVKPVVGGRGRYNFKVAEKEARANPIDEVEYQDKFLNWILYVMGVSVKSQSTKLMCS